MPEGHTSNGSSLRRLWRRHQDWAGRLPVWGRVLFMTCLIALASVVVTVAVDLLSRRRPVFGPGDFDYTFIVWAVVVCELLLEPLRRLRTRWLPQLPQHLSAFDLLLLGVLYVFLAGVYVAGKLLLGWPPTIDWSALPLGLIMLFAVWYGHRETSGGEGDAPGSAAGAEASTPVASPETPRRRSP